MKGFLSYDWTNKQKNSDYNFIYIYVSVTVLISYPTYTYRNTEKWKTVFDNKILFFITFKKILYSWLGSSILILNVNLFSYIHCKKISISTDKNYFSFMYTNFNTFWTCLKSNFTVLMQ